VKRLLAHVGAYERNCGGLYDRLLTAWLFAERLHFIKRGVRIMALYVAGVLSCTCSNLAQRKLIARPRLARRRAIDKIMIGTISHRSASGAGDNRLRGDALAAVV